MKFIPAVEDNLNATHKVFFQSGEGEALQVYSDDSVFFNGCLLKESQFGSLDMYGNKIQAASHVGRKLINLKH